jgi:hypothetical protein
MPMIFKFIVSLVTALVVITGVSLVWPKLTHGPLPGPLSQVRDIVLTTDIGKQAAQTLGVQNEASATPVTIGTVAGAAISSMAANVQEQAANAVTREIILQIVKKIETLAPDQQQVIHDQMCK